MTETWTAPNVTRVEPDLQSDERSSLEQWVDYHRATMLTKCAGLSAEQLKQRPVAPSRLSLLGLVRHMADVERWWFRMPDARSTRGHRSVLRLGLVRSRLRGGGRRRRRRRPR